MLRRTTRSEKGSSRRLAILEKKSKRSRKPEPKRNGEIELAAIPLILVLWPSVRWLGGHGGGGRLRCRLWLLGWRRAALGRRRGWLWRSRALGRGGGCALPVGGGGGPGARALRGGGVQRGRPGWRCAVPDAGAMLQFLS